MKTTRSLISFLALAALAFTPSLQAFDAISMSDPATQAQYTISADGDLSDKQKTIQFTTVAISQEKKTTITSRQTTSFRTGTSKTVGQTFDFLAVIYRKFIANPTPGISLGELGSVEKGGAVEFIAVSPRVLRLVFKSETSATTTSDFSRADVENYLTLLTPIVR